MMTRNFKEAIKNRRTYYTISNNSPISNKEIEQIIEIALTNVPSAFNSQSTRIVLLLGKNHTKFWDITKETLKKIVPEESFKTTETKINNCFSCGYGTILFYEDKEIVEGLQHAFPTYQDKFPQWSDHTSGMHQFAVWTMLEDAGLGASLQHYNPLIDEAVAKEWHINPKWRLIAEMPFGLPTGKPGDKEIKPLDQRFLIFK